MHEQGADPEAARRCSVIADFLVPQTGECLEGFGSLLCVHDPTLPETQNTVFWALGFSFLIVCYYF